MSRHRAIRFRDEDEEEDDFEAGSLGMSPASCSPSTAQFLYRRGDSKQSSLGAFFAPSPKGGDKTKGYEDDYVEDEDEYWESYDNNGDEHFETFEMDTEDKSPVKPTKGTTSKQPVTTPKNTSKTPTPKQTQTTQPVQKQQSNQNLSQQEPKNKEQSSTMNFDNLRDLLVGVSTTPPITSTPPSKTTITTTNDDKTTNFPSAMAFDLCTTTPKSQALPPELISSFSLLTTTCNDSDIVPFKFDTPSPDDVVLDRRKQAFKQKKSDVPPMVKKAPSIAKVGSELDLNQLNISEKSTPKKPVKQMSVAKRKELEQKLKEKKDDKEVVNMVVIGHVDAGKSTLMGHLLLLAGVVDPKLIHKYQRESQRIGKGSFSFAWVMDEHDEERARGITMEVGVNYFETKSKRITLLDAPGHRDFVPNMITGTAQADAGILVIDARPGEFESGFEQDGQTKEHALLARSLGVTQLIVAINKLDAVEWSKERFDAIVSKLSVFLTQAGFRESTLYFLPCSGLLGENIFKASEPKLLTWYKGLTLIDKIDTFKPAPRLIEKPFRMGIHDVYKGQQAGVAVGGKIESGFVSVGDKLLVVPNNEVCTVKSIRINDAQVTTASAGENVDMGLVDIDPIALSVGGFLCDPESPIKLATQFEAQILTFNPTVPILNGQQMVLHLQSYNEPVTISKLISQLDKTTGEVVRKNPRCLVDSVAAVVELRTARPVPIELFSEFKQLGRVTLRDGGKTVAAGIVTAITASGGAASNTTATTTSSSSSSSTST